MEIVSLIISILSLMISVAFAIVEIVSNKKLNDINLEAELFHDIVRDYLTDKFPEAVSRICFPQNKLSNIVHLQNELTSLLSKLRFFRYCDKSFFDDIKKKLQQLEDYVVSNEDKYFSVEEQGEVLEKIRNSLTEIYDLIKNKYKNG